MLVFIRCVEPTQLLWSQTALQGIHRWDLWSKKCSFFKSYHYLNLIHPKAPFVCCSVNEYKALWLHSQTILEILSKDLMRSTSKPLPGASMLCFQRKWEDEKAHPITNWPATPPHASLADVDRNCRLTFFIWIHCIHCGENNLLSKYAHVFSLLAQPWIILRLLRLFCCVIGQ